MKILILLFLLACALSRCEHLLLGDSSNKQILHHTVEQYHAIPLTKRIKNYFYNDPNQTTINSLLVYDNLHSQASATVTAGGVGFTYVNLRLKSESGKGLDYDIGIYA